MTNLGDSPMYIMNGISESFQNAVGSNAPEVWALIIFGIVAFLALYLKLDRGATALLLLLTVGFMIYLGIIPEAIFYLMILIVAVAAAYGILQTLRQGAG